MDNLRQLQRFSLFRTIAALTVAGWMLLAVGLAAPARAQEPVSMVVIHIQDVSPKGGVLRLGLYDEARYPDDDATPVLRLFRFDPPGITLGHGQDPGQVLDLARCEAERVAWAVRPTGGRAIYHDEEWTYSFACRIADPEWGGSLHEAYARVTRLIHASLTRLGIPAEGVVSRVRGEKHAGADASPIRGASWPSCFASTASHEIELEGRKLVGSAQRRGSGALLQQGSVMLGGSHLRLSEFLKTSPEGRERARRSLEAHAASAGAWLSADRALSRWEDSIAGVLGDRVRRVSGGQGGFLLTLAETAPYTAAPAQLTH